MAFFIYSALLNAFIAGLLGIVVILKNRKELINRLFFGLSMSVVFWSLGYWKWMSSNTHDAALFWIRLLSIASLFIPIFYFHWILTFTELNKKRAKLVASLYALAIILTAFSFSPLFIKEVEPKLIFPFWPTPGILYDLYLAVSYLGITIYSLVVLVGQYKISEGPKKSDIKYILLGSLIGFGGGATNFFLWYNIPIAPYGNFLVSFYPIMLGIAIFKYQLFNVRVIYAELITFSIWIFTFVRIFFSDTLRERIINGGMFAFVLVSGILLIRAVINEIETREEMDRDKSNFVTIASHQLRAPVTAIKGYSSMLLEGSYGEMSEKSKDPLSKIFKSADHLSILIGDFLDLSRIERGVMDFNFQKADLKEIVESIFDGFKIINEKERKDLGLTLYIQPKVNFEANVDVNKIRQVMSNLIDNSIKYTPKGLVAVSLDKREVSGKYIFKVKDTGIGMDEETRDRIFKKFIRAKGTSKLHTEGVGLGLYVAQKTVESHGGIIYTESDGLDKGSTFYLELPINFINKEITKQ